LSKIKRTKNSTNYRMTHVTVNGLKRITSHDWNICTYIYIYTLARTWRSRAILMIFLKRLKCRSL